MGEGRHLVLRGGTVIDGTGSATRPADVAVAGGRIVAVGHVEPAERDETLEVAGLAIAPGFIDLHTHFDLKLLAEPVHLDGLCQGVTTYVIGHDGLGYAPASHAMQALFREYLAAINGDYELPQWRSVAEYLAGFDRGFVNVVYLLPHGLLRAEVAGMTRGPLTPAQLGRMKRLVAEGMEQGARGVSTGLSYFPGSEADLDELVAISRVVARHGGIYASHIRDYAEGMLEAIDEACEIGRRAGIPVQITHLRPHGPFRGRGEEVLAHIEAARERGIDVAFDSYTYLKGCTIMAAVLLAPEVYAGGPGRALGVLSDRSNRQALRKRMPDADWGEVHIAGVESERNKRFEGMRLSDLAASQGKDVFDACVDLLIEERLRVSVVGWPILEEDLRRNLAHPLCLIGSDAIAVGGARHPRACGTFARYLGRYVRELGLLPLEEAVRRITSAAAERLGLRDRGVVAEGKVADLAVFDPAAIIDRATYEEPRRLAEGVRHVLIGGELVLRDGRLTGKRPGRALRA